MTFDPLDYLATPWRDVELKAPHPADAHGLWSVVRAAPVAPEIAEMDVSVPSQGQAEAHPDLTAPVGPSAG